MKTVRIARQTMIALAVAAAASMLPVWSQSASTYTSSDFASVPMNLVNNNAIPLVMLNMSRDHQLSYKAYTDYSDLDDSGAPQTTYTDRIEYYGYFDSQKCYTYNTGTNRFEPVALAGGSYSHYCNLQGTNQWSGNFLNWATMTRMDVVRKLLYGGKRSTDTSTLTVLERQYLPTDAHAFAKYYNGNDIGRLTPFTNISPAPPQTTSTSSVAIGSGNRIFSAAGLAAQTQVGDQIKAFATSDPAARWMIGSVTSVSGNNITINVPANSSGGSGSYGNASNTWTMQNLSQTGISLCSLTKGDAKSQNNANPPIIRVAKGNFALWNANEGLQCHWKDKINSNSSTTDGTNGNNAYTSGLNASARNPLQAFHGLGAGSDGSAPRQGEYVVRIQVTRADLLGQEKVKQYGTTVSPIYKPIGLLQVYADQLHFGLLTGSYDKNVSGGVLRKKISSFTDEINPDDGTFNANTKGIVFNLDRLRMYGYNYTGSIGYVTTGSGNDSCTYQQIGFVLSGGSATGGSPANQGNCSTWGNPMAEIYLESLRYLAGKDAASAYTYDASNTNSKDKALGLTVDPWSDPKAPADKRKQSDPLSSANYCASINILNFNASVSGYDGDQMALWSDICPSKTAKQLTDEVGQRESLDAPGSLWFIGNNGSAAAAENNQLCSAKPIGAGFGSFAGLCPEAPTQKGTYLMAGMANYVNTNRIRNDLEVPPARENSRDLMATTYGIALATNVPKIEVNVGGKKVTILPAYRLDVQGKYGGGTLVDFKIVEQGINSSGNQYGRYYVNWEDSEMGGDYDMDVWGTIQYEVTGATQIKITTTAAYASTSNGQGFGYVISGTTQDGAHFHSGILGFNFSDPTGVLGCSNCQVGGNGSPSSWTYTVGSSSASLLEDPLWYAAKWGGPLDTNGNPTLRDDGTPANYFYAINPLQLENSLNQVFLDIVKRTSSGTAAAVVANNISGVGAMYQAYYEPLRQDAANREVSWIGTVQALFVDSYSYMREDANGNGKLDGYQTDPVIELYYDNTANQTKVRRHISTKDDTFAPYYMQGKVTSYNPATGEVRLTVESASGTGTFNTWTIANMRSNKSGSSSTAIILDTAPKTFMVSPATPGLFVVGDTIRVMHYEFTTDSLDNLRPLWNARKQLSQLAEPATQRDFAAPAETGRFIKAWVDANDDGVVDPGECISFDRNAMAGSLGYLDMDTPAGAQNVIDYIRGKEGIADFRNRTIEYHGTIEAMRLGDVAHSSPVVVGPPRSGYDLSYRDTSYATFAKKYANRRQMVYVGANDGMLHAFNGGFYDAAAQSFSINGTDLNGHPATAHPLGSEIWAYVPMNLLPHLKWLAQSDYKNTHVYYVDGSPQTFDVKIFANDADHPEGWGTVLVVGMRFGGGPMTVDITGDNGIKTFRSAYIIMDVTNPEAEPRLLAEIQVPDASFSTSSPAIFAIKDKVASQDDNKWFLIFGSGPTDLHTASTNNHAQLFILDLAELTSPGSSSSGAPPGCARSPVGGSGPMYMYACDTGVARSMTGDPVTVDWNLDYKVDSIYFGTAGGDANATSGRMMRMEINNAIDPANWSAPTTVVDVGQPIVTAPTLGLDNNRPANRWVFFGTGRFFVQADLTSTATQSIYGVIDNGTEASKSNLRNTSEAQVQTNGTISGLNGINSFNQLQADTGRGWYVDLPPIIGTAGTAPATRVLNPPTLTGGMLFTPVYQPSDDQCTGDGNSQLYGLYYTTGTAHPLYGLTTVTVNGQEFAVASVNMGAGQFSGLSAQTSGNLGANTVALLSQGSLGNLFQKNAKTPYSVRSGMQSWREE
ncbi:MAG: PilC/PilY family type IV pilus protein [Desulfobulbus sp.]|nr:PilC/PilY family type IV pilus protein [Desulfobulbus sp.]